MVTPAITNTLIYEFTFQKDKKYPQNSETGTKRDNSLWSAGTPVTFELMGMTTSRAQLGNAIGIVSYILILAIHTATLIYNGVQTKRNLKYLQSVGLPGQTAYINLAP